MRRLGARFVSALAVLALLGGAAEAAEPAAGAQPVGIKVHGHWTIDVLNPDGSRASHHEFQNALQPPGAANLARFLGKVNSPGMWDVLLYSTAGAANCSVAGVPCILSESNYPNGNGPLSVTVPTSGPNQDKLVLAGSFPSPDARSLFRVISGVTLCPTGSPGCSPGTLGGNFSLKDFDPIPVQAGQIIQITVVFSFS
jgi:hypothetical protein